MIKLLALISVIALCKADDYYETSIDHSPEAMYKEALSKPIHLSDLKSESSGYDKQESSKNEEVKRRGYSSPPSYGYMKKSDDYDIGSSYSSPYGYERPSYEKKSYERPQSYVQPKYEEPRGYSQPKYEEPRSYVQKEYSSPVKAMRRVEIKPIQSESYGQEDHTIDVKDDTPIVIHFRTHANRIRVEQTRVPDKPKEVEHTRSEDEPHRVVHEVYKPVIQEIREIIQPFRKVTQQVQPVVEEVQTVVHKSDGRRSRGGGDNEGRGGGHGGGYGGQQEYSNNNKRYSKRSNGGSNGGSNKKYNSMRDYLPQGSVRSVRGIPVYRSQYNGPAVPQKTYE